MIGQFQVQKVDPHSQARAGLLHTAHGVVETPVFMPVGTQATVKTLTPQQLIDLNIGIILANTYHLSLRPGLELIQQFSGLHDFMNWQRPILTDSGGFQVFSLSNMCKILDNGVEFRSHLDGSRHFFSPERVVELQLGFNSDIMMPLDICTPYPASFEQCERDVAVTTRWARQARDHWQRLRKDQLLFAIVQGGVYPDLRRRSAAELIELDLPGYAIGGLSVGEPVTMMEEVLPSATAELPKDKPRYLMGVGLPENMDMAIRQGVDMFDCVAPTRLARHGMLFVPEGRLSIKQQRYRDDSDPIQPGCTCYTCQNFSRAYLRHLYIAKEPLAQTLMSIHNIHYMTQLVKGIRNRILDS